MKPEHTISNGSSNGMNGKKNGCHYENKLNEENDGERDGSMFGLLRFVVLDLPLMLLFASWMLAVLVDESYHGPVQMIVNSFRRVPVEMDREGYYQQWDSDMTYYNRECGPQDISTRDSNDLLVHPDHTPSQAADIMMTHGAVVFKNVLSNETAIELRRYLESRNRIREQLPWHEKFWEGEAGERLALGLGAHDHPIITQALHEVGTHETVKRTVEALMGADPAIVEISTMTSIHGAPDQGIHTDSDYFGSSVLYARTFLHSYTMFMALQDTTPKMGATTVCPGSHHCANYDLEDVCLEHGAFEVSSNGRTGHDQGAVFQTGDAMMFNQNVWHRGPSNRDPQRPINRVMFIVTFISRTKQTPGDFRQQALGTYYYQRWNMWGHTLSDLKDVYKGILRQPLGALRALGLWKPEGRKWGITWIEQFARQLANDEDFYHSGELPPFVDYMDSVGIPKWLQSEEEDWEPFLDEMIQNWLSFLKDVNTKVHAVYFGVATLLWMVWWLLFSSKNNNSTNTTTKRKGFFSLLPRFVRRAILTHGFVVVLYFVAKHYINNTEIVRKAKSKQFFSHQPFDRDLGHDDSFMAATHTTFLMGGPTTMPEREDVLIGSRFDSKFLGIYNHMLDYHPGNQRYNELIHYFANIPATFLDLASDSVIENIHPNRFLAQDHTDGYWMLMNRAQTERAVKRAIRMRQHSWIEQLGTELLEVLADSRFGARRNTAMMYSYAPHFVGKFQRIVFDESEEDRSDMARPATTKHGEGEKKNGDKKHKKVESVHKPIVSQRFDLPLVASLSPRLRLDKWKHRLSARTVTPTVSVMDAMAGDDVEDESKVVFKRGDRVWVQYNFGDKWRSGHVVHILHQDKAFIQFDNGNLKSANYPAERIRAFQQFVEGDLVEVKTGTWKKATLQAVHPRGYCIVQFLGQDRSKRVQHWDVRKLGGAGIFDSIYDNYDYSDSFDMGDRILANYRGEGEWFEGIISATTGDGEHFDIRYDDGDFEAKVPEDRLLSAVRDEEYESELEEGESVIVNHKGKGQWFSATVIKIYEDGRCNVEYAGGKKDRLVRPDRVRRL